MMHSSEVERAFLESRRAEALTRIRRQRLEIVSLGAEIRAHDPDSREGTAYLILQMRQLLAALEAFEGAADFFRQLQQVAAPPAEIAAGDAAVSGGGAESRSLSAEIRAFIERQRQTRGCHTDPRCVDALKRAVMAGWSALESELESVASRFGIS